MKKISILFLSVVVAFVCYAGEKPSQQVGMTKHTSTGNNHNEIVPEVTYDPNENRISIEFEAEGSFTLIVKEADGQVIYSAPVVTNGNSYSYNVNLLPENYYVITITSVDDGYIGVLETEPE